MSVPLAPTVWGAHRLAWGSRTYIMGILNLTPDSFSRDGLLVEGESCEQTVQRAMARAAQMVEEGADLIDVGGESTRPGAESGGPLPVEVECQRVIPVIEALAQALPTSVLLSIDTYKAAVAHAALDAGAALVNDIWGLQADPQMAPLVAERHVPVVLMSNLRGQPRREPLADVTRQLARCLQTALDAGIAWESIILDPGFGFGLAGAENLQVLARLGDLRALGRPLLVGTSRKRHIGLVLGTPVEDRLEGTAATVALAIAAGAEMIRVHDVRQMARVARMADAVVRGWPPESRSVL